MLSGTGDVGPSVSSLTILRPVPNVGVVYDQFGNTASIYDQRGGMSWYSTEDRHGHITSQGYLFDPFRKREPLMPSVPYVPYDQRGVRRSGGKPYSASLRSVHAFRLPRGPCLAYDHVAITAPSRCLCAMDSSSNLALQY